MLTNREVILAKVESSYGTDAAPTGAANAVLVANPSWALDGLRMHDRNNVKNTLAQTQSIYGGHLKAVSFDVELKGSGAAGTAPDLGVLLRGCAFGETIVASTSVTYKPVSTGHESLSIYYYQDGKLNKILGARGMVTGNLEVGAVGMLSFTFYGHDTESDTALATPTYDSTVPVGLINVPFTIGAYSAVISKLAFDMGQTVAKPPKIQAANGYGEIIQTKRNLTGSLDPEAVLKATHDFQGILTAGTLQALDTGVIGGTAGNRYQITMPKVYYREMAPGEREGKRTYEMGFGAVENAGDDEISIAFT